MLKLISLFLFLGLLSTTVIAATENTSVPKATAAPTTAAKTNPATTTAALTTGATTTPATTTAASTTVTTTTAANTPPLDTRMIEKIMGVSGRMDKQTQTFRVTFPRNDLNILLNGVKLTPAMGLTSWAAFKKIKNVTTMKADVVVTENQANTILSLALDNGLAVVALHNHLLWESPRVMFIHLEGVGDERKLAEAIKTVFAKTQDTNDEASDFPLAAIDPMDTTLNPAKIDSILGTKGTMRDGAYKVQAFKTSAAAKNKTTKIINTAASFAGSDSEAVVDGDLSLRASDLHSVLKSLHQAGIAVVALHQHESNNTETRMVYLHYFGVGQTKTLAKGLRGALDAAQANDIASTTPSVTLLKVAPPQPSTAKTPQQKPVISAVTLPKKKEG